MESIGEKLRNTRTTKGYSLEQVARDTHIAKRFLEALEAEEFEVFPGEPYLLGFLRTYAEFLDLDPQEMVSLYKNLKIQEQPAPIEDLIVKKGPRPYVIAVLALLVVAGLGVGGFFLFRGGVFGSTGAETETGGAERQASSQESADSGREFVLEEQILERRFTEGDLVRVPVGENEYPLSFDEVMDGGVTLGTIGGSQELALTEEDTVDVNQDGRGDVRATLREVSSSDDPPTLVLRLDRVVQSPDGAEEEEREETEVSRTEPVGSTTVPERERSSRVIAEPEEVGPFEVEMEFRGYSWFRYLADGEEREEQYLKEGDTFRTTVDEEFRLWLSNAGVVTLRVEGEEVDLGRPGEVIAALVTWGVDEDDDPRLELVPVY
ncbi:MAG: helix-turn-helix domain-containing protein [Spirochaetaceae bacterium]